MSENNAADKLVGSQYLDLETLKRNVADANKQLNTIGKNIKFDFSKQIADEIKRSVEQTAKNLNVTLPVASGSSNSDTKSKISELERQEKVQIRAYTTLTKLKKSMLSTEDKTSAEYLRKGVTAVEQQIQKNSVLLSQRKAEVGYAKSMATVTEARLRSEKAIVQAQTKASAKPEEEAQSILKQQAEIKDEIYKIDKLIVSASDEDRISQTARKEVLSESNSILEESKKKLFDQNDGLESNKKIQNQVNANLEKEISHRQSIDKATKQQQQAEKERSQAIETIQKTLTALVTVYAANALKEFWNDSIEYGQKYYDLLTEIRIVSGANEEAALKMGERYRSMAQAMSVSSVEIAEAATEFWRQGLDDSQVDARLKDTTQYAKISGQEFKEAAEQVTAATNSMNLDSQRVVDVFSYLGDASASGADEIGIAMQKASASALEAGVSFEWLGAYIATVSEKTRQAPESIGNAFNSIMARIQSIKQKGYNEEDETKVNDVAKALSKIDVALLNNEGNWRNMSDIFLEIANQWNDLDDKTRAYLATTIAGTRQKNVFLTLMNDMSLMNSETDAASRAMELYEGAITSVGVATEKYAIWMESVEAAQSRMKAAFEDLYALVDPNWIKGFYDGVALLATGFANATDALHGMNLVLPIVLAGIASIIASGVTLSTVMAALKTWITGPIGAAVTAFSVGVVALTSFGGIVSSVETDIEESLSGVKKSLEDIATSNDKQESSSTYINNLKDRYIELSTQAKLSATEQAELDRVMDEIAKLSPSLAGIIKDVTGKYEYQAEVVAGLNKELREKQRLNAAEVREAARNTFSSLVETGESIRKSKASSSDKIALVDEFINARKDNESIDLESFVKEFAEEYIKSAIKSDADYESGILHIRNKLENAIGVNFSSREDKMITQFADWLLGEWTKVQDESKTLDSQENEWKQQIQSILAVFADMDQFQTDAYRNYGQEIVNEIIAGFDYDGDLESQLTLVSGKIMDTFGRLLTEEATMQADPVKGGIISQLESAYKEFSETGSKEALESYNKTVDQWNALGGVQFEKLDGSLIKEFAETSKAATEAANEINNATTAAERYFNETSRREYKVNSQKTGYFNDLKALRESYATGGFQSYRSQMDLLAETNPELFRSMADEHAELGKIYSGENGYFGEEAIQWLDILITNAGNVGAKWREYYRTLDDIDLPKVEDGSKTQEYIQAMIDAMTQGGEQFGIDAVSTLFGTFDDDVQNMLAEVLPGIESLSSSTMDYASQLSMLNEQVAGTTENALSFFEKLSDVDALDDEEMLDALNQLDDMLSTSEGIDNFRDAWSSLDDDTRKSIRSLFDDSEEFFKMIEDESNDSENSMKDFQQEIEKLKLKPLIEMGQVWKEVGDIVESVDKDESEMIQTSGKLNERINEIAKAQDDLRTVMTESEKTSESYTTALENLESVCGFAINTETDLALAQSYLAGQMDIASNSSAWLLNYLYAISGSKFNSSSWQSQLAALASSGDSAAQVMWGLIQNLQAIHGASVSLNNGVFSVNNLGSGSTPKLSRPSSSSRRSGGSGGSSGSSRSSYHSEIEDMLDIMEQIQDIRNHYRDMIQEARSYYEEAGYLTAAIQTYEDEKKAVEDNNDVLEANIQKIESLIEAKKRQLSGLSRTSEEYANVADELDGLQQAHQQYTLELMENQTALEEFDNAIDDLKNEIRDMEIELRETIHEAIEDREELKERMLQGTIDVENEIQAVIKSRYEKERDLALEAADAKREALEAEREYLSEQLEARRKLAEQEDKQLKLQQLQAKQARISADPTRKKEELELRKEIAELRDEMAWDLAEQEVEAQQESIDQQLNSLDEYIEYVERYYEDLFEHPQKLLEEVKQIMSKTDEEILDFLIQNNEEYANSSEAFQQDMVNSWKDMFMDMRGETETYWDEVEDIIAQGDEAIIAFLKENSADYKAAGKLQAEKYVDEWKKQLENLEKAYADMYKEISSYDYSTIAPSISVPTTGGGNGGSGGTGGGGSSTTKKTYKWKYRNNLGNWVGPYTDTSNALAFNKAKAAAISAWNKIAENFPGTAKLVLSNIAQAAYMAPGDYLKQFKLGGLANFTGPAWLDGTKSAPERILSPYQTKLFEDMIGTLHAIKVSTPLIPANVYEGDSQVQTITFGDIIIQVESLDSNADYHDMADRVMDEIMNKITRGAAVGGIRKTR